jgi:hypothetical protein
MVLDDVQETCKITVDTKLGECRFVLDEHEQVKLTLCYLKESVTQLETNIKFNKSSLREAIILDHT